MDVAALTRVERRDHAVTMTQHAAGAVRGARPAASAARRRGLARSGGWSWWPLATATVLSGAGLAVVGRSPRVDVLVDGHLVGDAAMALACGTVASMVLRRLPRHPVGFVFAGIGAWDGVSVLASATAVTDGDAQMLGAWFAAWVWVPALLLAVAVLPLVLPEGLRTRAQRLLLAAALGTGAVLVLALAAAPELALGPAEQVENPIAVPGATVDAAASTVAAGVVAIGSVLVLLDRFRRAQPAERRQIAPFVAAGGLAVVAAVATPAAGRVGVVLQDVTFLLVPLAALVSVLRYRLYDIELVVHHGTVWLILTGVVVVGYVVGVQAVSELFGLRGRAASVVVTALVAVGFAPARAAVQGWVSRLLRGATGDPYATLSRTTHLLVGGADPRGSLRRATDDLAVGLRSPGVRVVRGGCVLAGSVTGRAAIVADLRSAGVSVGRLEVLARSSGERYSRTERRLVGDLAAPMAAAVAAVGLAEDLRGAREGLARAREDERRSIHARLHDDVGPAMAALLVQTEVVRRRLDRGDLDGARAVLDGVTTTAAVAAADVRGVSDRLGPDALEQVGLPDAVRALSRRLCASEVAADVTVEGDLPARLPAAVESAAYRIVAESLANVHRHAYASRVDVRLIADGEMLVVEVRDDGRGAGAALRPGGTGVPSMRARAEELGGSLVVSGAGGASDGGLGEARGTTVRAMLPVRAAPLEEPRCP